MDEIEIARVARETLKRIVTGLAKGDRYYDSLGRRLTPRRKSSNALRANTR